MLPLLLWSFIVSNLFFYPQKICRERFFAWSHRKSIVNAMVTLSQMFVFEVKLIDVNIKVYWLVNYTWLFFFKLAFRQGCIFYVLAFSNLNMFIIYVTSLLGWFCWIRFSIYFYLSSPSSLTCPKTTLPTARYGFFLPISSFRYGSLR